MIIAGAGVCPLVKIGNVVKELKVIDIICDRFTTATCKAYKALAMLRLEDPYKDWHYVSPAAVKTVDCNSCPVLAKDPNHFDKTKRVRELIRAAEERGEAVREGRASKPKEDDYIKALPHEHKAHDRFELIDLTGENER